MTGRMSELWGAANSIITQIEHWLHARDKKQLRLHFRLTDQARLLKLRLWEHRYSVEIPEILDLTMPILRAQVRRVRRSGGLGISIAAMTGPGAEKILVQELKKKYPDAENISVYREHAREQQLQAEQETSFDGMQTRDRRVRSALDSISIGEFARTYSNSVMRQRMRVQAELSNPMRKRKAYRGNCWR
jgi:hypothetical protein